jgi:hypothetical protein
MQSLDETIDDTRRPLADLKAEEAEMIARTRHKIAVSRELLRAPVYTVDNLTTSRG